MSRHTHTSPTLLAEVLDGIKIYFDFMMEDHLLYGPEREQFKSVITDRNKTTSSSRQRSTNSLETAKNSCSPSPHLEHTPHGNPWQPEQQKLQLEPTTTSTHPCSPLMPSQVYGAEHLLRLFIKLPLFLCHAQLPSTHVQLLHHHFKELLTYLFSRRGELFSEENYENTSVGGGVEDGGTKTETASTTPSGGVTAPSSSSTPVSIS